MLTNYPVIILMEPQLAVNIGLIARVMLNFKFTELRLVNPRDKEAVTNALNASAGADTVLNNTKIFNNLYSAVEDLNIVYALTKRFRNLDKPSFSLQDFFNKENRTNFNFYKIINSYEKIGFLFGKESSGLSNYDLNYANVLIHISTNEDFDSLNISQAVGILCYEWFKNYVKNSDTLEKVNNMSIKDKINKTLLQEKNELVTFKDLEYFFNYLENRLNSKISLKNKKYPIVQRIRNILLRADLNKSEVNILFKLMKNL